MKSHSARKPGPERREEIAAAALRIISQKGLRSLTTATLAGEVGLSSGALFRHFSTVDEILEEAVRRALARVEETFPDASLPPGERLFQLARNRIRLLGSDPGIAWLLRSEQAHLTLPEQAVQRLRQLVRRSKRYLLDAIREGAGEGSIRDDIPAEVLLIPVTATIHALIGTPGVHGAVTAARRPAPDRVLSALEQMLAPPGDSKAGGARRSSP